MADKKTTKTASGAQQYVAGSNTELNGAKSRAAINRAKEAIRKSDLTVRQKSKADSLLLAADNANMSKIITNIAGSGNSTSKMFDAMEKGWEELAKKNDKIFADAGMAKGGLAKKKKK
jgi:hypothetical protein